MITGATSGFGRATAEQFARNGFDIIITGRRKERLDELEKELLSLGKIRVLSLNFDVRNREEVANVISKLPEEWKAIEILVNNAGLAVGMDHIDAGNIDDWERMIDTNVKGSPVCYQGSCTSDGCQEQWSYFQHRFNSR